jgi:hypothetical protein
MKWLNWTFEKKKRKEKEENLFLVLCTNNISIVFGSCIDSNKVGIAISL